MLFQVTKLRVGLDKSGDREYASPSSLRRTLAIHRINSRYARSADLESRLVRSAARLWGAAADRADLRCGVEDRAGGAVSGSAPAGAAGNAGRRMGCIGEQS